MLRAVSSHRPSWPSYIALSLFIAMLTLSTTSQRVGASPLPDFMNIFGNPTSDNNSTKNSTTNSIEISTENLAAILTQNLTMNSTENSMENSTDNSTENSTDNSTEITPNTDVYVIKAVVYEIGILTDSTDNTTSSESTERQESVDISLYSVPQEDEFS